MSTSGQEFSDFIKMLEVNGDKLPPSYPLEPPLQFEFNNSTCYVCNGYYGPSFGEPVCVVCHTFVFPDFPSYLPNSYFCSEKTDDGDSGNDEPSDLNFSDRRMNRYPVVLWYHYYINSLDNPTSPEDEGSPPAISALRESIIRWRDDSGSCPGAPSALREGRAIPEIPNALQGRSASPEPPSGTHPLQEGRAGQEVRSDRGCSPEASCAWQNKRDSTEPAGAGQERKASPEALSAPQEGRATPGTSGTWREERGSPEATSALREEISCPETPNARQEERDEWSNHEILMNAEHQAMVGSGSIPKAAGAQQQGRAYSTSEFERLRAWRQGKAVSESSHAAPIAPLKWKADRGPNQNPLGAQQDGMENFAGQGPPPQPPCLARYLQALSTPRLPDNLAPGLVEQLPSEVLLCIFSYLDDLSLCACAVVCERWWRLVRARVAPPRWAAFAARRWPLYRPLLRDIDWHKKYQSLVESCFCRNCLVKMCVQAQPAGEENAWRRNRLRIELKMLRSDPPEGIAATPLDLEECCHWQASITGPVGSPYEGGIFYLYIQVPYSYPMSPPVVRFLTRILHPNVSRHGDVGIDSVHHNWSLALTISKVLISIQSLLTDPYTAVCMEPEVGEMYEHDRARFEALARAWTWRYAMLDVLP